MIVPVNDMGPHLNLGTKGLPSMQYYSHGATPIHSTARRTSMDFLINPQKHPVTQILLHSHLVEEAN